MTLFRSMKRCAALAAAFAIALQALWPLIAQARPAERTLTVALCSAESAGHSIEIPLGRGASGEEHCKMCVLGDGKDVAPVTSDFPLSFSIDFSNQGFETATASLQAAALRSAQPRAPPQIS